MADNDTPNKHNKPTPNTLKSSDDFSDLERIGRKARRHTAEDIAERIRLSKAESRIPTYLEALPGDPNADTRFHSILRRELEIEQKAMNRLGPKIELREETQRERAINLTQSSIERAFARSSINGQSSEFARTDEGQRLGTSMMKLPYSELEKRRAATMNQIGSLEQRALGLSEDLYNEKGEQNPEKLAALRQIYAHRNRLAMRVGGINVAQKLLRGVGKDPESELNSLLGAGSRAEKTLFEAGVTDKLKTGNLSRESLDSLKQKEIELSKQLVEALEKLKNASDETAGSAKEAAQAKKKELEETQEAVRQGGGQGGGAGGIARIGAFAAKAGAIIGAATNAYDNIAIGQTNLITTNRTAAANAVNDIYNRRMRAAAGDMTQLTMFEKSVHEQAIEEAFKSRTNKQVVNTGHTITAGLGTLAAAAGLMAAGSIATATGVGAVAGVPMITAGLGILASTAVAGGLSNFASSGADLVRGGSANREFLDEFKRQQERGEAELYVTGQQRQRLYDFGQGMRGTALAAGRGRGGLMMDAMEFGGTAMIDMVNKTGLTPDQFTGLAAQAARSQGSVFNLSQVEEAANMQRAGVADIGTIMGMQTRLAGAGANNPQAGLSSVLELAFTKSLNSAESLNRLVENTGTMAERSVGAAVGMQMTTAAAGTLTALINPNIENKEFAINRAATAADIIRNMSTDTSATFSSMLGITDISRAGKVDFATATAMRRMDPATLNSLAAKATSIQSMSPREREAAETELSGQLRNLGLVDFTEGSNVKLGAFTAALKAKRTSLIKDNLGLMMGLSPEMPGYKELMAGDVTDADTFLKRHQQLAGQANKYLTTTNAGVTFEELLRSTTGAAAPSEAGLNEAKSVKAGESKGMQKILQEQSEQIGKAQTSEMKKAAEEFGGNMTKALNNFLVQMKQNQEALLGTDAKKGESMSKDFGDGAKLFNSSVANFGNIINDFARKYNVGGGTGNIPRPSISSPTQDKKQ